MARQKRHLQNKQSLFEAARTASSPLRRLRSRNQERALRAKGAKLRRIAKPASFVFFWNRSGIGNALVFYSGKSCLDEKLGPLGGRKQMNGNTQNVSPLMRVRVVPVVVDEQPRRSAFAQ